MEKIQPQTPFLLLLYGFPGSGKTYFARQFGESVQLAHLEQDRIRYELFEQPRFTKQENFALNRIMEYMSGEFLTAGISVIFDMNAMRISQRRILREVARKNKASTVVVWFQVDADTAYIRNAKRDRRKQDDRFAVGYDVEQFKQLAAYMQHPEPTEDFVVVSGKHSFTGQMNSVLKKLDEMKVVSHSAAVHRLVKPELVNIVPSPQVEDPNRPARRNIVLR
ncbi:ATP-binding protein [Candidatus Saccharibacteria bacterium]|nr:ATP-binding protein [Candidatus Saccharibacteria bacterium]